MTGKWFFVYKDDKDGKVKAVDSPSNNMPVDHPELDDTWKIATKADSKEEAIENAIELDNEHNENDRILS
jgi:hypothetical protein